MNNKTFFPFYEKRICRIADKLQSGCINKDLWSESIQSSIADDLYEVFHRAAVRCLIVELHICKDAGLLSGETDEEEYGNYCCLLENEQYVNTIYQKYPGLLYYLEKLEKIQTCFWQELLWRLTNDWEEIRNYFHIGVESHVLFIRRSGSDFHCKGKSVVIIETDQKKKFFYKPHHIGNEIFLQNLLADIYRALGLKEFLYLELEKKGYGWVEEVTWEECRSIDEVANFYKRVGILAAIAYVLGIGDLHYENIIAHGEFPVIIDAETLFQHMDLLYQWTEKTTNFYSVLSSGLFPGGTADQNMAGITGGDGSVCSKKFPLIMHDKTSKICVDYQNVRMKKGKNYIRYMEKNTYWEDFEQEIIEGFKLTYEWFCKNKDEILREIYVRRDKLISRYVSGGTQFFGLSIFASVHPVLMVSRNGRRHYLEKMCKNRKFGTWELEAMLWGDIPYFFKKLVDQRVYDDRGNACDNFIVDTIEQQLCNRIQGLSIEDSELQVKVIALSCKLFGKKLEKKENDDWENISDKSVITFDSMKYAKNIADYVWQNAVKQQDRIYWLGIESENEILKIKPVNIYFYNGIAGIAVFFRKMYQACGLYEEVCNKLEGMLFSYTDCVINREILPITEYTGMYCGEGSVVYAYQLLYKITGKKRYQEYAEKHIKILIRCAEQNSVFDLTYGNAGAVLVLCQQYIDTGNSDYLSEARRVLEYLDNKCLESEQGITWFEKAEGNPVCSIAHGNSGVMLAYAMIQSLDAGVDYWERIKQIIKYEDWFYNSEYNNWADLRKNEGDEWRTYTWCNGGLGVVAARIEAANWNSKNVELFIDKRKIEQLIYKFPMQKEMCLCHGNIGNYAILYNYLKFNCSNNIDQSIFLLIKKRIMKEYSKCENNLNKVVYGFMDGLAGIGFLLCVKSTIK